MKFRYTAISAILIILTVTAVAGCTSTTTTSPTVSSLPPASIRPTATSAPAVATATAVPTISGPVPVTLFDTGKFNWYEYKTSTTGGETYIKTSISTAAYGGVSSARRLVSTTTAGTGDQAIVYNYTLYYNPGSDQFLGGHVKASMGGTVLYDKDIAAGDSAYAKSDYVGQSVRAEPEYLGNEPISVPRASYPTSAKYSLAYDDETMTCWIAPGVPVPVQMTVSSADSTMTMWLVDYG